MNFEEQSSAGIGELLGPIKLAFKRYWRIALAPASVVFLLVALLAIRLPDYYSSDVKIFIQPQKITSEVIATPEKDEQQERLEALIQEILSRPRLREIIEKFAIYPENTGVVGKEKALRRFRKDILLEPILSASGKALVQTFRIEYSHTDPKLAFEVTSELSKLFIDESIITQRTETQGTEEFLDAQLRKARKRLETTEGKVQEFVRQNFGKLPEHLDQALQRLENARAQLSSNTQLISANATRTGYLQRELQMAANAGTAAASRDAAAGNAVTSVAQLERALKVLRTRYSDKHPDVVNTRKRLEALKKAGGSGGGAGALSLGASSELRGLRTEIAEINVQAEALKADNKNLRATIEKLEKDVNSMPLKEQELIKIRRDYDNVKDNYQSLLAAREAAGLQSSLVRSQKGTQFKVVEPASLPVIPTGPQRGLILALGLAAALGLLCAIPLGLHFVNDSFKFRDDVEKELGIEVLGIIPPMSTPTASAHSKRAVSTSLAASIVAFVGGSLIVFVLV